MQNEPKNPNRQANNPAHERQHVNERHVIVRIEADGATKSVGRADGGGPTNWVVSLAVTMQPSYPY